MPTTEINNEITWLLKASPDRMNDWVSELYSFVYDGIFRGSLLGRDDTASDAFIKLLRYISSLDTITPDEKIKLNARLIHSFLNNTNILLGSQTIAASLQYEILCTIEKLKLYDAIDILSPFGFHNMILKDFRFHQRDLHHELLLMIPSLYRKYSDPQADTDIVNKNEIVANILDRNLIDHRYAAVSFYSLGKCDSNLAFNRIPLLMSKILESQNTESINAVEEAFDEFLAEVSDEVFINGIRAITGRFDKDRPFQNFIEWSNRSQRVYIGPYASVFEEYYDTSNFPYYYCLLDKHGYKTRTGIFMARYTALKRSNGSGLMDDSSSISSIDEIIKALTTGKMAA